MNYWRWFFGRVRRQLWWHVVLYGVAGIFTAIFAMIAERFIPWELPLDISRDAVESLLGIISSSMLAVTTFSLGAMTTAFGAATSNVTPRATKLLMEDRVTHNVLATFIGAFVFSIVGMIVLKTGSYGERGRAVLFIITILVITLIVVQLLRWINHLISLGRVGTTIERVEQATSEAMTVRQSVPYLGGQPWLDRDVLPDGAMPLCCGQIGYLQFVDIPALSELCEENGLEAWLPINAGAFTYADTVLLWVTTKDGKTPDDELRSKLIDKFVIASTRSFEQDPRFGLAVLSEVGSRALSPATNDPGTALDVIGRQTRLMAQWAEGRDDVPVTYPRLHVHPLSNDDLFEDAFLLMARDGAHLVEIQLRLQKSLNALQRTGSPSFRAAARKQAKIAMERAQEALTSQCDRDRLSSELDRTPSSAHFNP